MRWLSETKAVALPNEKVIVNYVYTNPDGVDNIRQAVSDSLLAFGEWRGGRLTVWMCLSDAEFRDVHERLVPSSGELLDFDKALGKNTMARLLYAPMEMQKLVGLAVKTSEPNLIINSNGFLGMEIGLREAAIKHEISHKLEVDLHYAYSLSTALSGALMKNIPVTPKEYRLLRYLSGMCDDISANELAISLGQEKAVFVMTKFLLEDWVQTANFESFTPAGFFIPVMMCAGGIVPFDNSGKVELAYELGRIIDSRLSAVKTRNWIDTRRDVETILLSVKNPPNVSDVEMVYGEVLRTFREIVREFPVANKVKT